MGLRHALQKYKDIIFNEEASEKARAVHAMKVEMLELMRAQGINSDSFEYVVVKNNTLCDQFPAGYLLNSLRVRLPKYQAIEIIEAYLRMAPIVSPDDTMITAEHLNVSSKLIPLGRTLLEVGRIPEPYEQLFRYAMTHTEDWHLIEPLIFDRGARTLPNLINMLTVVKETGHTAMGEGAL